MERKKELKNALSKEPADNQSNFYLWNDELEYTILKNKY